MVKAVIFDMFETLITHYQSPLYMGRQIAADIGIPEKTFREVWDTTESARTLGQTTLEDVIETVLRRNGLYTDALFEKIITKRKLSKIECFRHLHPLILPMLSALREQNIRIGLITNCYSEEESAIRDSILYPYFDAVCMSCALGISKPDPAIFRKCTDMLSVSCNSCMYVGDGGSLELETAHSLGMYPFQAVWYLQENVQQIRRNPNFVQLETPMDVLVYTGANASESLLP